MTRAQPKKARMPRDGPVLDISLPNKSRALAKTCVTRSMNCSLTPAIKTNIRDVKSEARCQPMLLATLPEDQCCYTQWKEKVVSMSCQLSAFHTLRYSSTYKRIKQYSSCTYQVFHPCFLYLDTQSFINQSKRWILG